MKKQIVYSVLAITLAAAPFLTMAQKATVSPKAAKMMNASVVIRLSADNSILVRGAKVMSMTGGVINASTAQGSFAHDWIVGIGTNTKYWDKTASSSISLNSIKTGDIISFSGKLNPSSAQTEVAANSVRDWAR